MNALQRSYSDKNWLHCREIVMKEDALTVLILWLGMAFFATRIAVEMYRGIKYVLFPKLKRVWQMILRLIFPRNAGTRRLCFFIGILLSGIAMVKFRHYTGFGQMICGASLKSCYLFGTPTWRIAITAFCIPFVIAKIIDFIIQGYNETKDKE